MTVISLEIDDMKFELNVGYQCWLSPLHLLVATYSVSRKIISFFLLKKLSGQTLTSWVDRSGLAQYFRITGHGKSKHLLVGFHLFVNSKLLTRSQRSEAMSSLEYSTFCHFSWMAPNFKSLHMSWNRSYEIYKSNRTSFLGPVAKYCLSVGLICWTTMVIGNRFKSERRRISIVGHKLTAGLEPYFANSQRVEAAKLLYGAHFER